MQDCFCLVGWVRNVILSKIKFFFLEWQQTQGCQLPSRCWMGHKALRKKEEPAYWGSIFKSRSLPTKDEWDRTKKTKPRRDVNLGHVWFDFPWFRFLRGERESPILPNRIRRILTSKDLCTDSKFNIDMHWYVQNHHLSIFLRTEENNSHQYVPNIRFFNSRILAVTFYPQKLKKPRGVAESPRNSNSLCWLTRLKHKSIWARIL